MSNKVCFRAVLFVGVVVALIPASLACNGYSVKLNSLKPCVANPLIKFENPGVTLDSDCNLILQGCADITQPFKAAKGTYTIKKPPMPPLEGELDFCEMAGEVDDPRVGTIAKLYNLPTTKCPVPKFKVCSSPDKKINISKYKNQLGIAVGTATAKIDVKHDNGATCYEVSLTVSRSKNRG